MSFWWHSRFFLPWGTHGPREEGRSPLSAKDKESVCLYLYLRLGVCVGVFVCVWPLPARASYSSTHNDTLPLPSPHTSHRCSQCHGCQSKTAAAAQWEPRFVSPREPIRSKQGKLCHYEMHSWTSNPVSVFGLLGHARGVWAPGLVAPFFSQTDTGGERLPINISSCLVMCVNKKVEFMCKTLWLNYYYFEKAILMNSLVTCLSLTWLCCGRILCPLSLLVQPVGLVQPWSEVTARFSAPNLVLFSQSLQPLRTPCQAARGLKGK